MNSGNNIKAIAHKVIDTLPDTASWDDVMNELMTHKEMDTTMTQQHPSDHTLDTLTTLRQDLQQGINELDNGVGTPLDMNAIKAKANAEKHN